MVKCILHFDLEYQNVSAQNCNKSVLTSVYKKSVKGKSLFNILLVLTNKNPDNGGKTPENSRDDLFEVNFVMLMFVVVLQILYKIQM